MKLILSALTLIVLAGVAAGQEISREEIRRADVPGSETMVVVVNRLTVPPGATIPLHTHPGDEHAVVISTTTAKAPNGKVLNFPIGTPLFFPEGQVHGGLTNIGESDMIAITTTVVRKGEPFVVPAN